MEANQLQAKDLRIGNYVEFDSKTFSVKEIRNYIIICDRGKGNVDFTIKELKPIPISEEILIKMGLFKSSNNWFRSTFGASKNVRETATLHYNLTTYTTSLFGDEALEAVYLKEVFFIHQLQNLYFAITGEELTFKK